jgi:hypothetical protein
MNGTTRAGGMQGSKPPLPLLAGGIAAGIVMSQVLCRSLPSWPPSRYEVRERDDLLPSGFLLVRRHSGQGLRSC